MYNNQDIIRRELWCLFPQASYRTFMSTEPLAKRITKRIKKDFAIVMGIVNFVVSGMLMLIIAIQGNRLLAKQNEVAEIEFSPALNVVRHYVYDEKIEEYNTIEIHVYNYNFPISEFSGTGQCVLSVHTQNKQKDYLLRGVFFASAYSNDGTGLLIRSFENENNLKISNYIKKCHENSEDIVNIDTYYYYRFSYRDALGEKHEKYFDLTSKVKTIELEFDKGRKLFEANNNLEILDYYEEVYPTFD